MRFCNPNYDIYRTDREDGHKGGNTLAVKQVNPHTRVDIPPLISVEATRVCIPTGNTEMSLVAVYKS
jgi:hypothetical protein